MMDNNTNIEIIEDKTLELEFIVHGESHGVCNALRHILMQDSDVEYAVYNIDHPLTGEPDMTSSLSWLAAFFNTFLGLFPLFVLMVISGSPVRG